LNSAKRGSEAEMKALPQEIARLAAEKDTLAKTHQQLQNELAQEKEKHEKIQQDKKPPTPTPTQKSTNNNKKKRKPPKKPTTVSRKGVGACIITTSALLALVAILIGWVIFSYEGNFSKMLADFGLGNLI